MIILSNFDFLIIINYANLYTIKTLAASLLPIQKAKSATEN